MQARNWIGGRWVDALDGSRRAIRSPIDLAEIGSIAWSGRPDAVAAITAARAAQPDWRKVPPFERARHMRRIADEIRRRQDALADLLTLEQGKPLAEARFETGKAADGFDLAADMVRFMEG